MDDVRAQRAEERFSYWGDAYLQSTRESYRRAAGFFSRGDAFTAYLYLFVAFNNLYCLLARFRGGERAKIGAALKQVRAEDIDRVYTPDYVELINSLNQGRTEQFVQGPDAGAGVQGIVNMGDYFLGKDPVDCVAHVGTVAPALASTEDKRRSLEGVASSLLYTVRNNQFHAIKGPHRLADQSTLGTADQLLLPLGRVLMSVTDDTRAQPGRSIEG